MRFRRFVESVQTKVFAVPKDYTGAVSVSGYLSLAAFQKLIFHIRTGAWAGGTAAVTLTQATDAAGTGAKALEFDKYWLGGLADVMVETAVVSDTFNISAANKRIIVQVNAEDAIGSGGVDESNGFAFVQLNIASPGSNADFYCGSVEGFWARLETTPDKMDTL